MPPIHLGSGITPENIDLTKVGVAEPAVNPGAPAEATAAWCSQLPPRILGENPHEAPERIVLACISIWTTEMGGWRCPPSMAARGADPRDGPGGPALDVDENFLLSFVDGSSRFQSGASGAG